MPSVNFYTETLEYIDECGYNISDVDYCLMRTNNGTEVQFDFSTFKDNSDFVYDDGFGANEVNLSIKIVFNDGNWLERWEYDGSEGWELVKVPYKDVSKNFSGKLNFKETY